MAHDLTHFTLKDMTECGAALRRLGAGARSMEETAGRIVRQLHEHLVDRHSGQPSCALVRFFKTHSYAALGASLREFADGMLGAGPSPPLMKCLTLLATVGERAEWNSREASVGDKAIPLPSKQAVARVPMISQLVKQLGLEVGAVVAGAPGLMLDAEQKTYNVFYVPDAVGSPHIPAQDDFVLPYAIRSVLGFGGVLPRGDLFAVILFSKVPIPRETSALFKPLALCVKTAVLPFVGGAVFT